MNPGQTRPIVRFGLLCCCILISLGFASAWAGERIQGQDPAEPWPFRKGRVEIGLQAGGGLSLQDEPRSGTVFALLPRVGYVLYEAESGARGSLEIAAQPSYLTVFQGPTSHVWGLATLLKYNIRTGTRVIPFVELGAGVSLATRRTASLGSNFNFILQAGVGLQYTISDQYVLHFQWLYQHLSNANLYPDNLGLNTGTFLLGASWLY